MRRGPGLALAVALLGVLPAAGCGSIVGGGSNSSFGRMVRCPKPVAYDDATLKKIEKARETLPRDSILLQVLEDYENERDELRFCK